MSVGTKSPFCSLERLAKHAFLPTSCGVCTYWMKLVGDYWPHGQHGLAMLLRQAQQVSSIHRGTSASSEAASRTKSRKTVQGLRTMSGRGQTEQPTCQIELGLSARNSKHPDAHVAWHTSKSVAEKAPRPPPIRWPQPRLAEGPRPESAIFHA